MEGDIDTDIDKECPLQGCNAKSEIEVMRQQVGLFFLAPAAHEMGHNVHFKYTYCALLLRTCMLPCECASPRRFFKVAQTSVKCPAMNDVPIERGEID